MHRSESASSRNQSSSSSGWEDKEDGTHEDEADGSENEDQEDCKDYKQGLSGKWKSVGNLKTEKHLSGQVDTILFG